MSTTLSECQDDELVQGTSISPLDHRGPTNEDDHDSRNNKLVATNGSNNDEYDNTHRKPSSGTTGRPAAGLYDAEKCRQHIANQIRVSKIDRFANQLTRAAEIEGDVCHRLANLLDMFTKCSARVATEFALKCKLGLQRHRLDRILNHSNNNTTKNRRLSTAQGGQRHKPGRGQKQNILNASNRRASKQLLNQLEHYHTYGNTVTPISNDLLYGEGAALVQALLCETNQLELDARKLAAYNIARPASGRTRSSPGDGRSQHTTMGQLNLGATNLVVDNLVAAAAQLDSFEPDVYVGRLECCLRLVRAESGLIAGKLVGLRGKLEQLAAEHRAKVDQVYAAEEVRQSTSVVRRSAYNLSQAAIKATTTPVHVTGSTSSTSGCGDGAGVQGPRPVHDTKPVGGFDETTEEDKAQEGGAANMGNQMIDSHTCN